MALVRMSTQMIENHLFVDHFSQAVRIHFHLRPEFLGTINEGIAAFDESGRFLAANHEGQIQLGLAPELLLRRSLPILTVPATRTGRRPADPCNHAEVPMPRTRQEMRRTRLALPSTRPARPWISAAGYTC